MNKKDDIKKVFSVSIERPHRETEHIYLHPAFGRKDYYLTIGNKADCDIISSITNIPSKHRLLDKSFNRYILRIPVGVEAIITIGESTLPVKGIVEFGLLKKKGNFYIFSLPKNNTCVLIAEDLTLTFGYKEVSIPKKEKNEKIKLDKSLKKPIISRENYSFYLIFILSFLIHFSLAGYVSTLEIKKKDHLEALNKIPQRFARLIFQPPKPMVSKTLTKTALTEKKEEEIEKKEKKEKEEVKAKEKEEAKKEIKEAPQPSAAIPTEVASLPQGGTGSAPVEVIREKIKSKGLLGVIMAKTRPMAMDISTKAVFTNTLGGSIKNIDNTSPARDIDDIISQLNTNESAKIENFSEDITLKKQEIKSKDIKDILEEKKGISFLEAGKNETKVASGDKSPTIVQRNESEVYRIVGSYVGGLKYIYNNALRKDSFLKGAITVKILISWDGKVIETSLVSSTLNSPELEDAIIKRIYKWHFPEVKDADNFIVTYTFDFSPVG